MVQPSLSDPLLQGGSSSLGTRQADALIAPRPAERESCFGKAPWKRSDPLNTMGTPHPLCRPLGNQSAMGIVLACQPRPLRKCGGGEGTAGVVMPGVQGLTGAAGRSWREVGHPALTWLSPQEMTHLRFTSRGHKLGRPYSLPTRGLLHLCRAGGAVLVHHSGC